MYSYDNKVLHREKYDTTTTCTQGKVKTSVYKQTNVLLSIKMPTMSSIINKNHNIQLIHITIFSLDRTIQKKKKNENHI